ncbi:MAG: hypothetical protein ABFR50_11360 [Candidatus Fermentibacteria bacterium]
MLEPVLGSLVREQVLVFIHTYGEGFAREISRYFEASLDSVQKQLKRLEKGAVLVCEQKGRTLIYSFNKEYPLLKELVGLLDRVSCPGSSDTGGSIRRRRCFMRKRRTSGLSRVTVKEYGER